MASTNNRMDLCACVDLWRNWPEPQTKHKRCFSLHSPASTSDVTSYLPDLLKSRRLERLLLALNSFVVNLMSEFFDVLFFLMTVNSGGELLLRPFPLQTVMSGWRRSNKPESRTIQIKSLTDHSVNSALSGKLRQPKTSLPDRRSGLRAHDSFGSVRFF